jgi:hypothetical protein
MDITTPRYLNKYFLERKCNNILERDSKNKYVVKNEDYEPFFLEGFIESL